MSIKAIVEELILNSCLQCQTSQLLFTFKKLRFRLMIAYLCHRTMNKFVFGVMKVNKKLWNE